MDLEFDINHQHLTRTDKGFVVNLSDNYLRLSFTFKTTDWDNLEKYVLVKHRSGVTRLELVEGAVILPEGLLRESRLLFTVYGVDDSDNPTYRITTNGLRIGLNRSGYVDEYSEITDVITQHTIDEIFEKINKKVDKVTGKELTTNDFTDTYKALIDSFDGDFTELINAHLEGIVEETISSLTNATFYTKPEVDALLEAKDNQVILEGNKNIMQTGETLTLKAYVKRNGVPVADERVEFYIEGDEE